MFSLSNTEHVFEGRSNASLRCESLVLFILAKKILAKSLILFSIFAKRLKIFKDFPGKFLVNRFFCNNSIDALKEISTQNFHNRILSCVLPISSRNNSVSDLLSDLVNDNYDIPGLEFLFFNVDEYVEPRLLGLVSTDGFLNQVDKKTFQLFIDYVDSLCENANRKGITIILYTPNFAGFSALHAIAIDLMQRYNTQKTTVFLLFHLCHLNSQKRIVDLVRMGSGQGFTPGIAIAKYLTSEYINKKFVDNNHNDSNCHSFNETKRVFYEVTKFLFNNIDHVSALLISHNPDNILYLTSLMEGCGVGHTNKNITFLQRYGMAKTITFNLASRGYNVATITPYGSLTDTLRWMHRLYSFDPSLPNIFAEQRFAILRELNRRKLEN
ncbi:MAG TPA: hypothetical protein ENN49_01975 [Bacteroidales bacterium]|nr:hypothetical protein [Bacteroidales bacterium]